MKSHIQHCWVCMVCIVTHFLNLWPNFFFFLIRFERSWPTFNWGDPNHPGMKIRLFLHIFVSFITRLLCLIYVSNVANFLNRNVFSILLCNPVCVCDMFIIFIMNHAVVICLSFYIICDLIICVLSRACDMPIMWHECM